MAANDGSKRRRGRFPLPGKRVVARRKLESPPGRGTIAQVLPYKRSASAHLDPPRGLEAFADHGWAAAAKTLVEKKNKHGAVVVKMFGSRAYRCHHSGSGLDMVTIVGRDTHPALFAERGRWCTEAVMDSLEDTKWRLLRTRSFSAGAAVQSKWALLEAPPRTIARDGRFSGQHIVLLYGGSDNPLNRFTELNSRNGLYSAQSAARRAAQAFTDGRFWVQRMTRWRVTHV